jgi:hypothetical protein
MARRRWNSSKHPRDKRGGFRTTVNMQVGLRSLGVSADGNGALQSVYGTLFLAGSMAASRSEDRARTRAYLNEANDAAQRLGTDRNHLWTAFGPTNVAIHRVNTTMELGDIQVALDVGPGIDTRALPAERRARHLLDVARAYSQTGRNDAGLAAVLEAEQLAPELVRHHYIGRQLVLTWIRNSPGRPSVELDRLARRLRVEG